MACFGCGSVKYCVPHRNPKMEISELGRNFFTVSDSSAFCGRYRSQAFLAPRWDGRAASFLASKKAVKPWSLSACAYPCRPRLLEIIGQWKQERSRYKVSRSSLRTSQNASGLSSCQLARQSEFHWLYYFQHRATTNLQKERKNQIHKIQLNRIPGLPYLSSWVDSDKC